LQEGTRLPLLPSSKKGPAERAASAGPSGSSVSGHRWGTALRGIATLKKARHRDVRNVTAECRTTIRRGDAESGVQRACRPQTRHVTGDRAFAAMADENAELLYVLMREVGQDGPSIADAPRTVRGTMLPSGLYLPH
jgi:hypothetical protein